MRSKIWVLALGITDERGSLWSGWLDQSVPKQMRRNCSGWDPYIRDLPPLQLSSLLFFEITNHLPLHLSLARPFFFMSGRRRAWVLAQWQLPFWSLGDLPLIHFVHILAMRRTRIHYPNSSDIPPQRLGTKPIKKPIVPKHVTSARRPRMKRCHKLKKKKERINTRLIRHHTLLLPSY